MKPTQKLHELGQSLWVDNITRKMLREDTLKGYIEELSVTGLTSNPSIFEKAIGGGEDYDEQIAEIGAGAEDEGGAGVSAEENIFFELALADLRDAADLFADVHRATAGVDGFVSLEVSPLLADDAKSTIDQAADLHAKAERDNLFIKIPGTPAGAEAIEESIFAGIPINVTLLFDDRQYLAAADAYMKGIERRIAAGLDPVVQSVASIFMSRWDVAVADEVPAELKNRLGIAIGGRAYRAYRELLDSDRWMRLANQGARAQRLHETERDQGTDRERHCTGHAGQRIHDDAAEQHAAGGRRAHQGQQGLRPYPAAERAPRLRNGFVLHHAPALGLFRAQPRGRHAARPVPDRAAADVKRRSGM